MAAHAAFVDGRRTDVPLRVLYESYYTTLTSLYAEANAASSSTS